MHAAAASSVVELLLPFLASDGSFTQSEASCAEGRAAARAEAEPAVSKAGEAEAQAQEAALFAEQKEAACRRGWLIDQAGVDVVRQRASSVLNSHNPRPRSVRQPVAQSAAPRCRRTMPNDPGS